MEKKCKSKCCCFEIPVPKQGYYRICKECTQKLSWGERCIHMQDYQKEYPMMITLPLAWIKGLLDHADRASQQGYHGLMGYIESAKSFLETKHPQ